MKTKRKSKLIALFSMLAMILVGAGATLTSKGVVSVEAAKNYAAEADFTKKTSKHQTYNDTWTYATQWTLFGAANNDGNWAYMKFGGKNTTISGNNPVYTRGQITGKAVGSVDVVFNAGNLKVGSVNSWGLKAYSNSGYTTQIASVLGGAMTAETAQTLTLTPTASIPAGSYYEVYFDLANTSGTNGIVWVDKIQFVEDSGGGEPNPEFGTLTSIEVANPANKQSFYVGDTFSSTGLTIKAKDNSNPVIEETLTTGFTTDRVGLVLTVAHKPSLLVTISYTRNGVNKTTTYSVSVLDVPTLKTYKKITSADGLHVGSTYIISGVKGTTPYTMTTTQNDNNRSATATTYDSGDVLETADTQKIELVTGTKANTYGLKAINGDTAGQYLKAGSSSKNYLHSETTLSDDSSWALTFNGGVLSAVAQGTNSNKNLKFNDTNNPPIFSCYGSGQTAISLNVDESTLLGPALVTSFTVEPQFAGSIFTTSALQSSDFTVSITKDENPGSSSDYTVEIGKLEGATFTSRAAVVWGVTKPVTTDNVIRFKSIYPQTSGGSDHLTVDIAISVVEPSLSSISITGSMTKTNYFTTDVWAPAGLLVTAFFENDDELNVTNNVTWSYNPTNPNNINTTSVIVTATYQGKENSKTISGITITEKSATPLVISEAYGGGGNKDATYKRDFIELYNNTNAPISLNGYYVFYASAAGSFSNDSKYFTALSGSILAKSYFLIQQAAGTGGTVDLPTPDITGEIAIGGVAFKIALTNSNTTPTGPTSLNVIDFLGAGETANNYETAKAPAPSNTDSVSRAVINGICVDTDDNSADFIAGAPTPMNSALGVAAKIMAYSSVPGTTAECAEKYNTIKPLVLSLSVGQLAYFQEGTVDLMVNARARYLKWAAANRDSTPYVDGSSGGNINFFNDKNSIITFVILISILGVSTLAGYYFIRKRPKVEETN